MQEIKSYKAEIKHRGQLTIPKKIREAGSLEEGQTVVLLPIGDSLFVTPDKLELDESRRQFKKILKNSNCSLEDILAGIQVEREQLFKEVYGQQSK